MIALDLQVIARLEVQPKAIAGAEVACQPKGRIGGDGARPEVRRLGCSTGSRDQKPSLAYLRERRIFK